MGILRANFSIKLNSLTGGDFAGLFYNQGQWLRFAVVSGEPLAVRLSLS